MIYADYPGETPILIGTYGTISKRHTWSFVLFTKKSPNICWVLLVIGTFNTLIGSWEDWEVEELGKGARVYIWSVLFTQYDTSEFFIIC